MIMISLISGFIALLVVIFIYFYGLLRGREKALLETTQDNLKAVYNVKQTETKLATDSEEKVKERLQKYTRD